MEKLVVIIVVLICALVTGGVLLAFLLQPVEITEVTANRIRVEPINTSSLSEPVRMQDHFTPLFASPSEVISSMLEVGQEAENIAYVAYFRLNRVDYDVLDTAGTQVTVRVGERVDPSYIVYGITEFAVLLNDTSTNSFVVVKYFRS